MTSRTDRPKFLTVPLASGLRWSGGGGWLYQEKADGCWYDTLEFNGHVLVAEQMRGGQFIAHDVRTISGQPVARMPLHERWAELRSIAADFPAHISLVQTGTGGEFLEAVLARGGEGIVAKHLDSWYGEPEAWVKCKRVQTEDCVVMEKHPEKMSIRLGQFDSTGQLIERGWCACLFSKFERVHVGDVVEITCLGLTAAGKFREPRAPRVRQDKPAAACLASV